MNQSDVAKFVLTLGVSLYITFRVERNYPALSRIFGRTPEDGSRPLDPRLASLGCGGANEQPGKEI